MEELVAYAEKLSRDGPEYQHHLDGTTWRREADSEEWKKVDRLQKIGLYLKSQQRGRP